MLKHINFFLHHNSGQWLRTRHEFWSWWISMNYNVEFRCGSMHFARACMCHVVNDGFNDLCTTYDSSDDGSPKLKYLTTANSFIFRGCMRSSIEHAQIRATCYTDGISFMFICLRLVLVNALWECHCWCQC